MYRQLLKTYVPRSKQLELNKKAPKDQRWCNFLHQKYIPVENFYTKQAGKNMCMDCTRILAVVKQYIKDGRITQEQFKEDPSILEKCKSKSSTDNTDKSDVTDNTLECVECKETKDRTCFDINRNICKKCRRIQSNNRIAKTMENDIKEIERLKNDEKKLKQFVKTLPVNEIFSILKHYNLTRKSTDKKDDVVFKIIENFRNLQDTHKCIGNCGFSLKEEFSCCDGCKNKEKKTSVEERNHLFKENLEDFMEGRYELTEEDMYSCNSFCIHAIAEYLGITLFKTKKKGDTKEKMVKIINETLKKKKDEIEEQTKSEQKAPELELNGVVILSRDDGYVNATKLCQAGGKLFSKWYRLESTKELIQVLKSQCPDLDIKFVDSKKGGNHSGSWIHPDLAIQLAQWISPVFTLQISRWIRELALTGSVVLRNEKSSEELLKIQKEYKKLESNHKKILEKRQYHKFKKGPVFYIISDTESNCVKFKPGLEGVDINVRLAQHRSTCPSIKLEFLIYSGMSECKLLETAVLQRYAKKRNHLNHEWIFNLDKKHIISSTITLLDFLGIEYTREEDIDKYNN